MTPNFYEYWLLSVMCWICGWFMGDAIRGRHAGWRLGLVIAIVGGFIISWIRTL